MFGNFIYFIVAILIYSTYQPAEQTGLSFSKTVFFVSLLVSLFAGFNQVVFRRVQNRIHLLGSSAADALFQTTLTRQSVLAVLTFAFAVYFLNLPSFFIHLWIFRQIPTAVSLLFVGLFVFFMAVVWACAFGPYRIITNSDMSRRDYILSNISFSIPVVLPWLLLSGVSDVLFALPFDLPKRLLSTTEGQIVYFLMFLFGVAVFGPPMIQKFWQCKPLENGFHRLRIESLCQKAGFSATEILRWPLFGGRMITAGIMGLVKKFQYLLVTDALLRYLRPEEIDAVIAHEIGHVKKKHLLFYLFFFVGYVLISYACFDLLLFAVLYSRPLHRLIEWTGLNPAQALPTLFSLLVILLFLVYFRYVFGYFMRNFERQADIYVYELFDSAGPLISTFHKIAATSPQSPDHPNWHHFSISERIGYLLKCESDRRWIRRHHDKIRKSIGVYVTVMAMVAAIGYQLNFGEAGKRIGTRFFEKILLREIEKSPREAELYAMLGDLYYGESRLDQAVTSYEHALAIEPENPRVLNNLAWLYATAEGSKFYHPEKALSLARKAAARDPSPHVLDTLAESFYANGLIDEAIAAERRAISLVKSERSYYEGQLQKFMNAANKKNRLDSIAPADSI